LRKVPGQRGTLGRRFTTGLKAGALRRIFGSEEAGEKGKKA
jgi:hypothetical protein